MIAKTIEIRDVATFIPALAVQLTPACEADRYLLARAGYGTTPEQQGSYVLLLMINGGQGQVTCDPYDWHSETMTVAHEHLIQYFDSLASGAVIDVEYLTGRRNTPKISEQLENDAR